MPFITIKTKAICKKDFCSSFLSGINNSSTFIEKTGEILAGVSFFDRNYYCGGINHEYIWIMRARRAGLSSSFQRIFQGKIIEKESGVEIEGRFTFPIYAKIWRVVFRIALCFVVMFIFLLKAQMFSLILDVVISLLFGAASFGISIGIDLLTSKGCEKDVLRYLESRK